MAGLIEPFLWDESHSSHLVFVDGHFQRKLSHWPASCILEETSDRLIFRVPPHVRIETPLQVISFSLAPRFELLLETGASLDLVHQAVGSEPMLGEIDVVLEEGARLNWGGYYRDVYLTYTLRATLKKNASLHAFCSTESAAMVDQDWQVALTEEGARAEINSLDKLDGQNKTNTRIRVEHLATGTVSRQLGKKILLGESRAHHEGVVSIQAQKSDARQFVHTYLLSDQAKITTQPFLDICADDVSVSHGATCSQPSAEELFYCQARGFSEKTAQNLLIDGFCREMIDAIPIPEMRKRIL